MHPIRKQLIHNAQQRCSEISGHLSGSPMGHQRVGEELAGCSDVSSLRHVHIDDLAVLIHGRVQVTLHTGDLDVGLVHKAAVTHRVTARARSVDQQRCESLCPPVDGDVINLDASLSQQFLDVAVRQPMTEVPEHSQQDHFGWEPVPGKGGGLNRVSAIHRNTLPAGDLIRQRNGATNRPGRLSRSGVDVLEPCPHIVASFGVGNTERRLRGTLDGIRHAPSIDGHSAGCCSATRHHPASNTRSAGIGGAARCSGGDPAAHRSVGAHRARREPGGRAPVRRSHRGSGADRSARGQLRRIGRGCLSDRRPSRPWHHAGAGGQLQLIG